MIDFLKPSVKWIAEGAITIDWKEVEEVNTLSPLREENKEDGTHFES